MTFRGLLIIFGVGTALAWGAWFLILNTVPPASAGILGEVFFFSSLFLAILGTLTIVGILGRKKNSEKIPSFYVTPAFRQGFILALAVVGTLLLQRFQYLRWWNILLLGGSLLMLDLALTKRRRT